MRAKFSPSLEIVELTATAPAVKERIPLSQAKFRQREELESDEQTEEQKNAIEPDIRQKIYSVEQRQPDRKMKRLEDISSVALANLGHQIHKRAKL